MKQSAELVEHGRGVIVYPEGTLTRDPDLWPMRGKTGAVRLALADGIPLIPMAQWGAQEIMARYGKAQPLAAAQAGEGHRSATRSTSREFARHAGEPAALAARRRTGS